MPRLLPLLLFALTLHAADWQVLPYNGLTSPFAAAEDKAGNLYVVEYEGNRVLRLRPGGAIEVLLERDKKRLNGPHGLALSKKGILYVTDSLNHRMLAYDTVKGKFSVIAGTGKAGFSGDGGPATDATFNGIFDVELSADQKKLYMVDINNRRVRVMDLTTKVVTNFAGNGAKEVPRNGSVANASPLVDPRAVAADGKGNVYILERNGNALRVVNKRGLISTVIAAKEGDPPMNGPKHIECDKTGKVWIADAENNLLRVWDPKTGVLTTVESKGLKRPHGVAFDRQGRLILCDSYNNRILRMK